MIYSLPEKTMTNNNQTLADVLAAVQAAPEGEISPAYRQAIASDLIRIGKILGAPLDTIKAERGTLNRKLNGLHPDRVRSGTRVGVSKKRITNLKTSLNRALKLVGSKPQAKPISAVSAPWRRLWTALPAPATGSYLRPRLSRLIRKMDALGLDPDELDAESAESASQALLADYEADPLTTQPAYQMRRTIRAWNQAVGTIPGWPQTPIAELATRQVRIARADFPATFIQDVEALRQKLISLGHETNNSFVDSLMEDTTQRVSPYRSATIKAVVDTLYNAAITVVECRHLDLEQVRAVPDVVEPLQVALFLEAVKERTGADPKENPRATMVGYASDLLRAARHHDGVDEAAVKKLQGICRRTTSFLPSGMTGRNRERLTQFQDPDAVLDLEDLEIQLINEAETQRLANGTATQAMAFTYMRGLALWLLRITSYRRRNILRLRSPNIEWPSGTGKVGFIWLQPGETKTNRELAAELDPQLVRALRHFWTHFRPTLTADPTNDHLFASRAKSGHVNENSFATQLSRTVARRTGLDYTFHFARHLTAEILLSDNRANMPVVSESLGHTPGSPTAARHYTAMSQRQAGRTVQDLRTARRQRGGRAASKPKLKGS
jgi:integrase